MTEQLDHYAPTMGVVQGTMRQLQRMGNPVENIPTNWIPAIITALMRECASTPDSLTWLGEALGFQIRPSESDMEYTLVDNIHRTHHTLKNSQVMFFSGILVDGIPVPILNPHVKEFIPPYELEISERAKDKCDCCGIVSHCLKEVLEPFSERLERLCNYCLMYHEHPRVNDHGDSAMCRDCRVFNCQHHPVKERTNTG